MPPRAHHERPLQIDEDIAFQMRMHRIQILGLWIFFSLLIASLLGFGGGGPLSHVTARHPDGSVELRYERFARMTAREALEVELHGGPNTKTFTVTLDGEFVREIQIESIYPEPDNQTSVQEGLRFDVQADPPGSALLLLQYRPLHPGMMDGRLQLGEAVVPFRQFVYP